MFLAWDWGMYVRASSEEEQPKSKARVLKEEAQEAQDVDDQTHVRNIQPEAEDPAGDDHSRRVFHRGNNERRSN
ncbi:hypothetical protein N7504_010126 [Penicillium tannophilum]|nr:hypothetical protein N7504_010126 [Penicillium tannophilum]